MWIYYWILLTFHNLQLFQGVDRKHHNQCQFDSHRERIQIEGLQGHFWNKETQALFGHLAEVLILFPGSRRTKEDH